MSLDINIYIDITEKVDREVTELMRNLFLVSKEEKKLRHEVLIYTNNRKITNCLASLPITAMCTSEWKV